MFIVVSYDIPDDGRRARVSDLLRDYGARVQRSVFECYLDTKAIVQMGQELATILEESEDDVRLYMLCERCLERVIVLGKGRLSAEPDYFLV